MKLAESVVKEILKPWAVPAEQMREFHRKNKGLSKVELFNIPYTLLVKIIDMVVGKFNEMTASMMRLTHPDNIIAEALSDAKYEPLKPAAPSKEIIDLTDEKTRENPVVKDKLMMLASELVTSAYNLAEPCSHTSYREEDEAFYLPITPFRKHLKTSSQYDIRIPFTEFNKYLKDVLEDHPQILPLLKTSKWPPDLQDDDGDDVSDEE
jgi:hypothetical protein